MKTKQAAVAAAPADSDKHMSEIDIQTYLSTKGIECTEHNGQLRTKCFFGDCTQKTKHKGHLYFNIETGQYLCQKCGASGNMVTLAKHFGDDPRSVATLDKAENIGKVVKKRAKKLTKQIKSEDIDAWHAALPDNIREWLLNERGVAAEVIDEAKLGWSGTHLTIPIPDASGKYLFVKKRRTPLSDEGPKYENATGSKAALFGVEYLEDAVMIVICEGELDALVLRSQGIPAVTSTGGAKTFNDEWVELFSKIEHVFICYDNDKPGQEGARRVGELIPHAKIMTLPKEVGEAGDLTDLFVRLKKTPDDFLALQRDAKTLGELEEAGERFKALPKPSKTISLDEWREVIYQNFPECLTAAEVGVAVITQLLIKDVRNPFGLVYVDVPSAGKTIALNFFSKLDELVYTTDSFSPASLVSHASNRKKEDLKNIDLLPRIRHKALVVRDLAPMFAERQENLLKNLGVLTRVFDGEGYESDSGVHGKRGYRGDYMFTFLAASTPIQPRVWRFMGALGSRLFFLNMNVGDKSEDELAELLVADDFKKKEGVCRDATRDLLLSIWDRFNGGVTWNKRGDPENVRVIISRCANLLAYLRGTMEISSSDEYSGNADYSDKQTEKPMRINQLLYNLARGHALACGRIQITDADLRPVVEVTLNSAQQNRVKLFTALIEHQGTMNVALVEEALGCSYTTASNEMSAFEYLGLANLESHKTTSVGRPEKIITIADDFDWFCSEEFRKLRVQKP